MDRRVFAAVALATALVLVPVPAQAQYLDPGASSVIVQVIIAGLVGITAVLGLYWRRLRAWFSRKSSSEAPTDPQDR